MVSSGKFPLRLRQKSLKSLYIMITYLLPDFQYHKYLKDWIISVITKLTRLKTSLIIDIAFCLIKLYLPYRLFNRKTVDKFTPLDILI